MKLEKGEYLACEDENQYLLENVQRPELRHLEEEIEL